MNGTGESPERPGAAGTDPLAELARDLRVPVEAPGLWARIERDLDRLEKEGPGRGRARRLLVFAAAAAVLCCAAGLFFRLPGGGESAPLLLDRRDAARMAAEEGRLRDEAALLAAAFRAGAGGREDAAAFAEEQLSLLDAGIEDCRRELERNPLNRAVRRALLACRRKKVEAVRTFLERHTDGRNEP